MTNDAPSQSLSGGYNGNTNDQSPETGHFEQQKGETNKAFIGDGDGPRVEKPNVCEPVAERREFIDKQPEENKNIDPAIDAKPEERPEIELSTHDKSKTRSKERRKKRSQNLEKKLTNFDELNKDTPVTSDLSDEYSPTSVTSSSSAFPQSVSSEDSKVNKNCNKCDFCGAKRKDSGYVGQYYKNKELWLTTSNSDTNSTGEEDEEDSWRIPLEHFTSKRQGSKRKHKNVPRHLRSFYKGQDNLINQFEDVRLELEDAMENTEDVRALRKKASLFAKWTFFINLFLLVIKAVAVVLSGSISLISSLVDSSVDLLSGLVIWVTTRLVKRTDKYRYPQGRSKLEPMAIVILSVIMSAASLQIIKESITKLIGLANKSQLPPVMEFITIGISCITVVAKLILYLLCRRVPHPTVLALAQDHKNDILSNGAAILFGYIGSQQMQVVSHIEGLVYVDPIGAILLCVYIIATWCLTGWTQIKLLVGHTASPEFLSKITWMAFDHHRKIEKVGPVKAFHYGNLFLVEVVIFLPPEMTLQETHEISQPLQQKIERLPSVERAFVHVDYVPVEHKRM